MTVLSDAVKLAATFSDTKSPHEGYRGVQLRPDGLSAICNGRAVTVRLDLGEVEGVANATDLKRAVSALGDDVELEVDGNMLSVIRDGGRGVLSLPLLSLAHAVKVPEPPEDATWHEVEGWEAVKRASWCTGSDVSRPWLCAVHLSPLGWVEATDGHAGVRVRLGDVLEDSGEVVADLSSVFGSGILVRPDVLGGGESSKAQITREKDWLFVRGLGDGGVRGIKVVDSKFPAVQRVFEDPRDYPTVSVDPAELLDVAREAAVVGGPVSLGLEAGMDILHVECEGPGTEAGHYKGEVGVVGMAGDHELGWVALESRLLISAIQAAGEEVIRVGFKLVPNGSLEPVYLSDDSGEYEAVIMPMRM